MFPEFCGTGNNPPAGLRANIFSADHMVSREDAQEANRHICPYTGSYLFSVPDLILQVQNSHFVNAFQPWAVMSNLFPPLVRIFFPSSGSVI